uniref:Uncharacterized protein n=1 Tax=Arundo donax TaxID=35708 RepID=A0A0A9BPS7_ARUDO
MECKISWNDTNATHLIMPLRYLQYRACRAIQGFNMIQSNYLKIDRISAEADIDPSSSEQRQF